MTYRISTPHLVVKRRLKEYLALENRLTLWKIYVMDMPLEGGKFLLIERDSYGDLCPIFHEKCIEVPLN
ncbi:hypothetical protein TNCT_147191 [Trichonephila clavata]|uniref:Uncharacterized protein n=1 Tax=Trichonephila clavata TaxID=2740835 RepID=A0A8X6GWU8_TRICU|nr:hypothetical protein TNCT_147191 [Trichonephila clavata]